MLDKLDTLKTAWQYCLPHHILSRLIGKLADCENTVVKNTLIKLFLKRFKVDLATADRPSMDDYTSFNDCFTRGLKPGTRPIAASSIVSPVDGSISQFGKIEGEQIFQAKGHNYTINDLLGGSEHALGEFENGEFATIYLAPKDYHRIHMPIDGRLKRMVYVPGRLFSVNQLTAKTIPSLFARNERVICYFETAIGVVPVIFVGAMLVASIKTAWAGIVAPHRENNVQQWDYDPTQENTHYKKGDEIGQFCFGSTVIVLFPSNSMNFEPILQVDGSVTMGQAFGELKAAKSASAA